MKRLLTPVLFVMLSVAACTGFEELVPVKDTESGTPLSTLTRSGGDEGMFDTLPNPYSLDVMQAVYDDYGSGNTVLAPTHLYVRFMPQDSLQLDLLMFDYGLELFEYPLDLDIGEDEVYVDPAIPEGELMWQYTTVGADFVFPSGVTYEIIEECYIPEDDEIIPAGTRVGEEIDVEKAAFERLGYTVEPETRGAERPVGTVRVEEVSGTYVGVKGVKIRCHTIVKWSTTYTDESGYYVMDSKFLVRPHYAIVFDNCKDFDIWGNWGPLARANYNMGWHSKRGHNRDIPLGSHAWDWAAVNNAGYDYYKMCESTGITKPPAKLKVWVFKKKSKSSAPMIRRVSAIQPLSKSNWASFVSWGTALIFPIAFLDGVFKWAEPDITIGTDDRSYREIYYTVNHEFSHASHFSQVGVRYWSKYISHIVQNGGYGGGTGTNAGICEVGEMWGYAMGHIQECEEYTDIARLNDPYIYSTSYPRSTVAYSSYFSPNGWIRPDPIWALITRGVLTKKEVFACLTSDVDTRDKLIDKMCLKYPAKADLIRMAFSVNDVILPTFTGPDFPALHTMVTYRVPAGAILPSGMTFNGFTVTGGTADRTFTVSGGNLFITFKTASLFTITATYTLPGGATYRITKTIDKRILTPVISADQTSVTGSGTVTVTVENPQSVATYEWLQDGKPAVGSRSSLPIVFRVSAREYSVRVKCRANVGGSLSNWSRDIYINYYPNPGGGFRPPITGVLLSEEPQTATDSLSVIGIPME